MVPVFPLGILKDEKRDPWFDRPAPNFEVEPLLAQIGATQDQPKRFCSGFPGHLDDRDVAIKFAGAGGDGAQTAAMLVAKAAIAEGFDATHIPSYGPESRGGTSYADVHVAREEVLSPASPEPHVLVAFNAPSLAKFGPAVRENGIVVYDSSVITEVPALRLGVRAFAVPFTGIALTLGNPIVKNMVALGALQEAAALLTEDSVRAAIALALHGREALVTVNFAAFDRGVEAVRERRLQSGEPGDPQAAPRRN
jgi:Pyruvate/2-oxoacid:ferredoxin oxidoreductase gamma subunit